MDISVFLGAPGSGKGTQAKSISGKGKFVHFSTGDMLRSAISEGSEVGKKAKTFIDRGDLVPDGTMIELIEDALSKLSPEKRVILDGFPRTTKQAEALESHNKTSVDRAIYFNVPESDLVKRLTGRRTCKKCGASYHIEFVPPKKDGECDYCGGTELLQRPDDKAEVVTKRLEVYREQTEPLLNYYRESKKLREVDANRPIKELGSELTKILES